MLRTLVGVLVLGAGLLAGAGAPALADDGGATIAWAPYLVVGATTVEIWNVADHATWPAVTVYLRTTEDGASCVAGDCTYRFVGPRVDPGRSWVFDPSEHACSLGLDPSVCLPDWAEGSASFEAMVETDADAIAGAVSTDPDGALIASVTAPTATYDAVAATTAVTLTDVARRAVDDGGGTTVIRVVGAAVLLVDWYLDGELVVEQQTSVGSDRDGQTGDVRAAPASIDPRDIEGLDDGVQYTVVITRISGADFAAVPSDATDDR
ncbi:MAG TPA: hypothetical protein VF001_04380 [Candidatus Limnocylindria bacterium]